MVSPVAQMILDLIENQLPVEDIQAINFAATNKLIARNRELEQVAQTLDRLANTTPAPPFPVNRAIDIYGSQDAAGHPVVVGFKYRIQSNVSPKYLSGITGIARSRSPRSRKRNMIEFEVEPVWRERCRRYLDPKTNMMGIPGNVLRPFK